MTVRYTEHAERQIAERGLHLAWVVGTLETPDWSEPDPNHPGRTRVYRAIGERDGRYLRVVYETEGAGLVVISAFLDRTAPRRRPKDTPP